MSPKDRERLLALESRLHRLEHESPAPHARSIWTIAREALIDEIARLTRSQWLHGNRLAGGYGTVPITA
ncbi:MAG: hypothetical protein U1F36_14645 [Planctomycetota bacterium]